MAKNAGVPGAGAKMWEDNKRYLEPGDRNWLIRENGRTRTHANRISVRGQTLIRLMID